MNIIDIFHTDSLPVVIRKCNENFRQLAFNNAQTAKMQNVDVTQALTDMQAEINQMISHTIPNEVSAQIMAADIPSQISNEVTSQLASWAPPVGAYIIADVMPSYTGTTWTQAGDVYVDTTDTVPVWKRVS